MYFWDWKTGYNFQKIQTQVQPGSLSSEAGIFALAFDQTGSRLISCECDKTIKIYKHDSEAVKKKKREKKEFIYFLFFFIFNFYFLFFYFIFLNFLFYFLFILDCRDTSD